MDWHAILKARCCSMTAVRVLLALEKLLLAAVQASKPDNRRRCLRLVAPAYPPDPQCALWTLAVSRLCFVRALPSSVARDSSRRDCTAEGHCMTRPLHHTCQNVRIAAWSIERDGRPSRVWQSRYV